MLISFFCVLGISFICTIAFLCKFKCADLCKTEFLKEFSLLMGNEENDIINGHRYECYTRHNRPERDGRADCFSAEAR